MFNTINVVDLVQSVSEGDGSIMFDLRLNKDCAINTLFDTLINNKTDKWASIRNSLHGKSVSIEYSDRYLYTPLGCMLLAHFISSLKQDFGINITSISISVTKPTSNDSTGEIRRGTPILISDISNYKMKIRGLSDNNIDLPVIRFQLNGIYYPQQSMLASYRVMIESAMCAAENTCDVKNHLNLFAPEGKEYARIVNFYRKYFKETYSEIFFRTVKLISNK